MARRDQIDGADAPGDSCWGPRPTKDNRSGTYRCQRFRSMTTPSASIRRMATRPNTRAAQRAGPAPSVATTPKPSGGAKVRGRSARDPRPERELIRSGPAAPALCGRFRPDRRQDSSTKAAIWICRFQDYAAISMGKVGSHACDLARLTPAGSRPGLPLERGGKIGPSPPPRRSAPRPPP